MQKVLKNVGEIDKFFLIFFPQIRLSYHTHSSSLTPGPLDLVVNFIKESPDGKVSLQQIHLTLDIPMRNKGDGWIRWEAALPETMQLR
jgi:hypothetical protein